MQNKQSVDVSFKELVRQIVLEVLEEHQTKTATVKVPELLTAEDIEQLTKGKIKKEQIWNLARNLEKNNFPASRVGKRKILVWSDEFWRWMKNGGLQVEDE